MDFSRSALASSFLVACGALRPEVSHVAQSVLVQAQAPEFWKRSDLNVACRDPMTCGPKGAYGARTEGRCRDFECSGCSLGKCMTVHEAKMCCEENSDCSAVYGGGSHWWTFNAPCEEEEHHNDYHIFHRESHADGVPDDSPKPAPTKAPEPKPLPTKAPAPVTPAPTKAPEQKPPPPPTGPTDTPAVPTDENFPAGLLTCHAGFAAKKTSCDSNRAAKSRPIRDSVIKHYNSLGKECTKDGCPRGDLAGCLVRLVGHDIMDFDPSSGKGGADGCIDFEDHDNKGLQGCLLTSVHERDSSNVSLELMWQDYCTEVSAADFFVIAAEALIEATLPEEFRAEWGSQMEKQFRFGRETQFTCKPEALPNPAFSCHAVEDNFIKKLGLNWRESTALMGVHTLGRALPENSGFDGFWVNAIHARIFDNKYYQNMLGVGWGRKKSSAGKWQWARADERKTDEMMLNTDMCLAFATGNTAPFTRAEDDSHRGCCLWNRNHTQNRATMDGVQCDCQFKENGLERGCSSHSNCCGALMGGSCPGHDPNNARRSTMTSQPQESESRDVRGIGESLAAVTEFARSMDAWRAVFLPVWLKVTTNGMTDLCAIE